VELSEAGLHQYVGRAQVLSQDGFDGVLVLRLARENTSWVANALLTASPLGLARHRGRFVVLQPGRLWSFGHGSRVG
jgi:hypothetical protein